MRCSALEATSACMSVFATTNLTLPSPAAIILLTTLPPAPPTPITVICGFLILLVPDIGFSVGGCSVVVSAGDSVDIPIAMASSSLTTRHHRAAPAGKLLHQALDHGRGLAVAHGEAQATRIVAPGGPLQLPAVRQIRFQELELRRDPVEQPLHRFHMSPMAGCPVLLPHFGDDRADQQVVERPVWPRASDLVAQVVDGGEGDLVGQRRHHNAVGGADRGL